MGAEAPATGNAPDHARRSNKKLLTNALKQKYDLWSDQPSMMAEIKICG